MADFTLRPALPDDDAAVLEVLAARDLADVGDRRFTRPHLLDRWRAADFDRGANSVVAVRDGAVAGFAAVFNVGTLAFVHPGSEGSGIGTRLLEWAEETARRLGRDVHRQRTAEPNPRAGALLHRAGYSPVRTVWQLACDLRAPSGAPPPPPGIRLDPVDPLADAQDLHAADAAAFSQNADYSPETLGDFRGEHLESPLLDRMASRVARRGSTVAGFAIAQQIEPGVGYLDLLAVAESERGRGLGTCLLHGVLGAFAEQGYRQARLDVASDNQRAMRLYERAGMTRRAGATVWEKPAAG